MVAKEAYKKALRAFAAENYADCIDASMSMLASGIPLEVGQLLLISLQRLQFQPLIDKLRPSLLAAAEKRPLYTALLRLTLGEIDDADALEAAGGDAEPRCQALFYIGARHATLGRIDKAKQAFDACIAIETDPEAIERSLARVERERLPRGDNDTLRLDPAEQIRLMSDRTVEFYNAGKLDQARAFSERAHDLARERLTPTDPIYLTAIQNHGTILNYTGEAEKALELFKESLPLAQQIHGDDSAETAIAHSNVALALNSLRRFRDAEAFVAQSVKISMHVFGQNHPQTAAFVGNLALNQRRQRRYAEAAAFYRKAYELRSAIESPNHPDSLAVLGHLAEMCDESGDAALAATLRAKIQELQSGNPEH